MQLLSYHPEDIVKYDTISIRRQWWDSLYGRMLVFESSHLDFEYKEEKYVSKPEGNIPLSEASPEDRRKYGISFTYRSIPVAKDLKTVVNRKRKNTQTCIDVFDEYSRYHDSEDIEVVEKRPDGVLFNIGDKSVDDFSYYLERNGINFDIIKD